MDGLLFIFYFLLAFLFFSVLNIEVEENLFLIFLSFIPLIVFYEPIIYGFNNVLYKIYNNEHVRAFEVFQIAFSDFKRAWGIRFRVLQICWIHVAIITISSILLFKSVSNNLIFGLYDYSFSPISILLSLILLITTITFTIKLYYYKFTYLIAFDNPSLSCKSVVLKSNRLMVGKRFLLFKLELFFIIINIIATYFIGKLALINKHLPDLVEPILTFVLNNQLAFSKIAFYKYYSEDSISNNISKSNIDHYYSETIEETGATDEHISEIDYYIKSSQEESSLESFDTFDSNE